MLKIFNDLRLFVEDNYEEISVRQYAKLRGVTPPTASTLLKYYGSEGILKQRSDKGYLLFRANRQSVVLKDLARLYWRQKLCSLVEYLDSQFHGGTIVLFGSLVKLETHKDSDIDIVVYSKLNKKLDLKKFERKFGRSIQLIVIGPGKKISKELRANIMNGYLLQGELR